MVQAPRTADRRANRLLSALEPDLTFCRPVADREPPHHRWKVGGGGFFRCMSQCLHRHSSPATSDSRTFEPRSRATHALNSSGDFAIHQTLREGSFRSLGWRQSSRLVAHCVYTRDRSSYLCDCSKVGRLAHSHEPSFLVKLTNGLSPPPILSPSLLILSLSPPLTLPHPLSILPSAKSSVSGQQHRPRELKAFDVQQYRAKIFMFCTGVSGHDRT
jgi:hypothetical protein